MPGEVNFVHHCACKCSDNIGEHVNPASSPSKNFHWYLLKSAPFYLISVSPVPQVKPTQSMYIA